VIRVFYCGYGYAAKVVNRNVISLEKTQRHYRNYFFIHADILNALEHLGSFEIRELNFLVDDLPRGITKEIAHEYTLTLTACGYSWYTPFELRKGQIEYKDRFKNYLKVFWNDDDPAPQNATVSSENETITAPPVQHSSTPKEKTSLLNVPTRQDDWFEVINEMANQFYAENGAIPTTAQVWNLLCTQSPTGYAITTSKDKGEFCLIMAGCNPLGKKAFAERWRKYTK
jgi:hypothetical protein